MKGWHSPMHPDYEYDRYLHNLAVQTAKGIEKYNADPAATGEVGASYSEALLAKAYLDLLERRGLPPDLKCYPSIQLRSGMFYDFVDPASTPIIPQDIAAGLSKNCRCTGQILSLEIYSVAQHSCHAHDEAPPDLKFKALMHDSPESVLNDMATPFKQMLRDYQIVEERVGNAIADQYSLPHGFEDEVKYIDLRMAATEKRDIMPPGPWKMLEGIQPYSFKIVPWDCRRAEQEWLDRFYKSYRDYLDMINVKEFVALNTASVLEDLYKGDSA